MGRAVIELRAAEFALELDSKLPAAGWTRVRLSGPGGEVPLGADDYAVVARRLRAALTGSADQPAGEIGGHPVFWVLNLSEQHSSFYARNEGQDLLLFLQGAEGNALATLRLGPALQEAWLALL